MSENRAGDQVVLRVEIEGLRHYALHSFLERTGAIEKLVEEELARQVTPEAFERMVRAEVERHLSDVVRGRIEHIVGQEIRRTFEKSQRLLSYIQRRVKAALATSLGAQR